MNLGFSNRLSRSHWHDSLSRSSYARAVDPVLSGEFLRLHLQTNPLRAEHLFRAAPSATRTSTNPVVSEQVLLIPQVGVKKSNIAIIPKKDMGKREK